MTHIASPTVESFLAKLNGVRTTGSGWQARCPCRNDDDNPSLSIGQGADGRVLVNCHRGNGCDLVEICSSVGVKVTDLYPPRQEERKLSLVATYNYRGEKGELLYQKQRFVDQWGKKTFKQRRPDPDNPKKWIYSLEGIDKTLYRLPEVIQARDNKEVVWLVEGEKDADNLAKLGWCATTPPNGAGKWQDSFTDILRECNVFIIADNDAPGWEHAKEVGERLKKAGCEVSTFVPPKQFKDVSELLGSGGKLEDLVDFKDAEPLSSMEQQEEEKEETDDTAVTEATSSLESIASQITKVLLREDLSEDTRISRANMLLNQIKGENDYDRGRLVNWQEFLGESADEEFDWVIDGLIERGERIMVVAAEGVGKRATLDSMIPTPSGWTTLGEISVGDKVIDRFGNPVNVTYVSPVEDNPDAYRVSFSDGNHIDADAEHQWYTETLNEREARRLGSVRTTIQIRDTLISGRKSKALNHAIPTTKPLNLPDVELPIPPYTLGAWLGDGTTADGSICSEDNEILDAIRNDGYTVRKRESTPNVYGILGLQTSLRENNLIGNKHIPTIYSRASYQQRLSLVQGLMDTDGYVRVDGLCEFSVNHKELAKGFLDVIQTLGIKATMHESDAKLYGRVTGTRYRISFKTDIPVCTLKRKAQRLPQKLRTQRSLYRYIVSVEPINPVPMRCISVDGPDNTYLIGNAYIPTHNTMLARQVAICSAAGLHPFNFSRIKPVRTLTIDLENPERIIRRTSTNIMNAAMRFGHTKQVDAHILIKPAGVDLLRAEDRAIIEETVERVKPDLLLIGPLYKSFVDPGGRTSEAVAVQVAKYFDMIRDYYKCAMWLEHHAPLGSSMSTRDLRPFGSAVWSRWPEFGLSLHPDPTVVGEYIYDVRHFRGARDERPFPTKLRRGKVFPFELVDARDPI